MEFDIFNYERIDYECKYYDNYIQSENDEYFGCPEWATYQEEWN